MSDWIDINADKQHLDREKRKAREMRNSNWWKTIIAKGVCHYCGKSISPSDLTMDHIVPISRGGKSTKGNIVPCCKNCNNEKKYFTPADMILKKIKKNKSQK
jgi:5-methylcytosine-specific restriction endonuclease McrA